MAKKSDDKLWGFLAVFLGIIGFVLVLLIERRNKYAMYYAKQSLLLFIAGVVVSAVMMVPIFGWITAPFLGLILFVLWIIGWVNALSGKMKPIPIIGKYADKIDL